MTIANNFTGATATRLAPRHLSFHGGPGRTAAPRSNDRRQNTHFLLVSAPFGPFGRELAAHLIAAGAKCSRVILNGGDVLDWGLSRGFVFRGGQDLWQSWLEDLVGREGITDIVTYGDSGRYAAAAVEVGRGLGLRVHVLEQGYFRPDWITVEREGVNAESLLPRSPEWYLQKAAGTPSPKPEIVGRTTPAAVFWIVRYHLAMYLGRIAFIRFRPGYSRPAALQALGHAIRFVLRDFLVHGHAQRRRVTMAASGPLFLVLLQRPGDSQLWRHSEFRDTAGLLKTVVPSFAAHAPPDARLMVRPHPLDPGLEPHEPCLARLAREHDVADRVVFVDDGKLHEILPKIAGAVCVNSTAGLAAIEFGRPTIVLGRALYDMPGLTHQGGLDSFWTRPEVPTANLYDAFRRVVIALTQVNGAFATRKGRRLAAPQVASRLMAASRSDLGAERLRSGQTEKVRDLAEV